MVQTDQDSMVNGDQYIDKYTEVILNNKYSIENLILLFYRNISGIFSRYHDNYSVCCCVCFFGWYFNYDLHSKTSEYCISTNRYFVNFELRFFFKFLYWIMLFIRYVLKQNYSFLPHENTCRNKMWMRVSHLIYF